MSIRLKQKILYIKKQLIKYASCLIPSKSLRKKFRRRLKRVLPVKESALAHRYLDGLNGIEIGASTQNSFGLHRTGAYANIDFDFTQGGKWQSGKFAPAVVNFVSIGDDLPFKDGCLDYVLSSHVIEHFFDPIKAIKEWHRVVKKGGFIFIICPHMDRTFDWNRVQTSLDELLSRHSGEFELSHYAKNANYSPVSKNRGVVSSSSSSDCEPHMLFQNGTVPNGFSYYESDDHHHWTTWRTESFLHMCKHFDWHVIEHCDVDDKVGNGFTIVLRV